MSDPEDSKMFSADSTKELKEMLKAVVKSEAIYRDLSGKRSANSIVGSNLPITKLNITIVCNRCTHKNMVPVEYRESVLLRFPKSGRPVCGVCREPLLSQCQKCDMKLMGKPKFYFLEFQERVYCYTCAKNTARDFAKLKIDEYKQKKSVFDRSRAEFRARHSEWLSRQNNYINERKWVYLTGVALPIVAGLVALELKLSVWFGVLVGLIVWLILVYKDCDKRNAEFSKLYPEPKFQMVEPVYPQKSDLEPLPPFPPDGEELGRHNCRDEILVRDQHICKNCGKQYEPEKLEVHHIIPRAKGGQDHNTNLITLCISCHCQEDWYGHVHKYRLTYRPWIAVKSVGGRLYTTLKLPTKVN